MSIVAGKLRLPERWRVADGKDRMRRLLAFVLIIGTLAITCGGGVAQATPALGDVVLDMAVRDSVADPVRGVFYATTRSYSKTHPAQLVMIDPTTGSVQQTTVPAVDAYALGAAADGSALYVRGA